MVRDCDAPPRLKPLLFALASYAGTDGRCYPSQAALMRQTGHSRRTVQRQLGEAVRRGLVVVEHVGRWRGDRSRYRLINKGVTEQTYRHQEGRHSDAVKGVTEHTEGTTKFLPKVSAPLPEANGSGSTSAPRRSGLALAPEVSGLGGGDERVGPDLFRRELGRLCIADSKITDADAERLFSHYQARGWTYTDLEALRSR